MNNRKHLTKSLFRKGSECPTKLYFQGQDRYVVAGKDDKLKSLMADMGFQVGELAKSYFRGLQGISENVEIEEINTDAAEQQTERWISDYSDIVLFEAAFSWDGLFARSDILKKQDNSVELIEVKTKLVNSQEGVYFWKKKVRALTGEWEPYIKDIAFQYFVIKNLHPEWDIECYLMLPDSSKMATIDRLNQMFPFGEKKDHTLQDVGDPVLVKIPVQQEVNFILQEWTGMGMSFEKYVKKLRDIYLNKEFSNFGVGVKCKKCEYKTNSLPEGMLSGFEKCWTSFTTLEKDDLNKPLVFDLWNFRESEQMLAEKKYFLEDIQESDIKTEPSKDVDYGMSVVERQKLQLSKFKSQEDTEYFDRTGFQAQMDNWKFPLNFIDFETTQLALPFGRGHAPFELMAFQFSVHKFYSDKKTEHSAQYINLKKAEFPSYDFVRALKKALGDDGGSVFCYSMHENSVLLSIYHSLLNSAEPDKNELCQWIQTLTVKSGKKGWQGSRALVDQCELVKGFYYNPHSHGSNSIKKILPAILQSSQNLRKRLSEPVYGVHSKSLNFSNWSWLKAVDQVDPYKSLGTDSIKDGADALKAYFEIQFREHSQTEIKSIENQLLKYCELDTYAMTLLHERFLELM